MYKKSRECDPSSQARRPKYRPGQPRSYFDVYVGNDTFPMFIGLDASELEFVTGGGGNVANGGHPVRAVQKTGAYKFIPIDESQTPAEATQVGNRIVGLTDAKWKAHFENGRGSTNNGKVRAEIS